MIREIRGEVLAKEPTSVTLDIAGLGIRVYTNATDSFVIGKTAILATHLTVKQDGIELYGFADAADRDLFELAITVSGVGPKKGLMLLTRAPREALISAVVRRDIGYLTRVAGLGKKTAEKMVVELSEKLHAKDGIESGDDAEVFDTLVALGYTEREARKALANIPKEAAGKEARLRSALGNGR